MKKTFLYETHVSMGAKMAPFGGYEMPIQYEGIIKEHTAARTAAALFDTCHMGEFMIKGPGALRDLENILSCKVSTVKHGQCKYGFICNENGGVIDDQIIYRIADDEFMMVVNASTEPNDFAWVKAHCSSETTIENISDRTAKLDIQGPLSPKIVTKLLDFPIDDLRYYTFKKNRYRNSDVIVSRTGYTGEIGFELYCPPDLVKKLWDDCISEGAAPAGLGARDTLRLEMGYPLYGHELDESTNAAESGFSRAIATDKTFIGSSVVLDKSKSKRVLCGIELEGRRAARNGDTVIDMSGTPSGLVTSGSFSPTLSRALALAYVNIDLARPGTKLQVRTGRQDLGGTVVELPFYKNATGRADMAQFLKT